MTDFDAETPLPTVVQVTQAFAARAPTQRVIDTLTRAEGCGFSELMNTQPFRVTAFRALLREFPTRDATSLWAHAYDVETEMVDVDPTQNGGQTPPPPSAATTAAYLET
jgi:hypothetical protein